MFFKKRVLDEQTLIEAPVQNILKFFKGSKIRCEDFEQLINSLDKSSIRDRLRTEEIEQTFLSLLRKGDWPLQNSIAQTYSVTILGLLRSTKAVSDLKIMLNKEPDPWLNIETGVSLGRIGTKEAIDCLIDTCLPTIEEESGWSAGIAAMYGLAQKGSSQCLEALAQRFMQLADQNLVNLRVEFPNRQDGVITSCNFFNLCLKSLTQLPKKTNLNPLLELLPTLLQKYPAPKSSTSISKDPHYVAGDIIEELLNMKRSTFQKQIAIAVKETRKLKEIYDYWIKMHKK